MMDESRLFVIPNTDRVKYKMEGRESRLYSLTISKETQQCNGLKNANNWNDTFAHACEPLTHQLPSRLVYMWVVGKYY